MKLKIYSAIGLFLILICAQFGYAQVDSANKEMQSLGNSESSVSIRYFGQSAFLVTTSDGTTILTDPVDFKVYKKPEGTTADIETVSHEQPDHK